MVLRRLRSCLGCCQLRLQPGTALSQKVQVGIGSCCCSPLVSQLRMGCCKLLAQETASIRQESKQYKDCTSALGMEPCHINVANVYTKEHAFLFPGVLEW